LAVAFFKGTFVDENHEEGEQARNSGKGNWQFAFLNLLLHFLKEVLWMK